MDLAPDLRPRLKSHLLARVVPPDQVFLLRDRGRHRLIESEAAAAVVPYLDGQHTVTEIAAAAGATVGLSRCLGVLTHLNRLGYLTGGPADGDTGGSPGSPHQAGTGTGALSDRVAAAWEDRGVRPSDASRALGAATVAVCAVGAAPVHTDLLAVSGALAHCGLRCATVGWQAVATTPAEFTVVLTHEYLDPRLGELDTALRAAGRPWLLAKPAGAEIWLGPYFTPDGGCWHCLAGRLDENRPVLSYLRRATGDARLPGISAGALTSVAQTAAYLIAAVVETAVGSGGPAALAGTLLTLDTQTFASEHHRLVARPQCSACGDPTLVSRSPQVKLGGQPPASPGSGYRAEPPEVTCQRLEKHHDRLLGIVTSLRPLAGEQGGPVHCYVAVHSFATPVDTVAGLRRRLHRSAGGKGATSVQAKASAMCEAIERYCGVWRDGYPAQRGRAADLCPQDGVAVDELLLFSPAQYAARDALNHTNVGVHHIPTPLEATRPIAWTPAWSLTHERERLLPAAYTWYGHPDSYDRPFCFPDSNGSAAGSTVAEAVLQGFCELVERDSVALWWYNRLRRPAVDLDTPGDSWVDDVRAYHDGIGRELWALDLTADLGIPAYAAVSRRTGHPAEDVLVGFGAHLDAHTALNRALTELNQFLPIVARRHPDGTTDYWDDDPATLAWLRSVRVAEQPWLTPDPAAAPRRLGPATGRDRGDLVEDVRRCVATAAGAGLEVIVCDQSRPDIDLSVVKVVVPGLRHFWRRLAPGRLYDVPVALGWLDEPTAEPDFNPLSVFF